MSALDWERDGRIWPHREASQFIRAGAARWHVQRMGSGPPLLLLHGTGASVHSWRGLMPLLAQSHAVIAPDLPRHAFTSGHDAYATSLPAMAREVAQLLETLAVKPAAIIGHSAGAAIALQLALDHAFRGPIIGLSAALRPFPGAMAQIFPAIAKTLFVNPLVPRIFTMMANWDLPALRERMDEVQSPILLLHGANDPAIPLQWAKDAAAWLPNARLDVLPNLGHLAHEEAPDKAAAHIAAFLQAAHQERQAQ